MKGKKGFTLVEIMIVVAIIGLLAAIAIPSLLRARQETQRRSIQNNLRIIADARDQVMTASNFVRFATVPEEYDWHAMIVPYLDVEMPDDLEDIDDDEGIGAMNWPGVFPDDYTFRSADNIDGLAAEAADANGDFDEWLRNRVLAVEIDLGSDDELIHFERGRR